LKKPILHIESVTKIYRSSHSRTIRVFDKFSFRFLAQQVTALLGPTGCGKSTLLNLINGLVEPDSGSITFPLGRNPVVGTVMQKDLLLPWRNVGQNVQLGIEINGVSIDEEELRTKLREFRLDAYESLYPDELSGGMKQKASLLRTLLFDPELVLLDEPFANIDYYQKLDLESHLIRWIRQEQRSSIFVTHDVEEAIAVADRLVVLSDKPARVVLDMEVDFPEVCKSDPILARKEPKFGYYFEQVWKALEGNAQ